MIPTLLKDFIRKSPALERAARRVFDLRCRLAYRHLDGIGLEIGALDRPLWLPKHVCVYYLDRMLPRDLRAHYPELAHRRFYVSLVGDGETLDCIADESLNFIVANHVIEHCEDPIRTLKTFERKLRPGGKIFMAVPDMDKTFDRGRRETLWEHLLSDHERGPESSRDAHYEDWVEKVEKLSGSAAQNRIVELRAQKYSIHFHCWTLAGFRGFLKEIERLVPMRVAESVSWRNENIFIITKQA